MKSFILIAAFVFSNAVFVFAGQTSEKIYINRGIYIAVDSSTFGMIAFNETNQFDRTGATLIVTTDDTLSLKVINNDSIAHGFDIKNYSGVTSTIAPGDSVIINFYSGARGTFIFYDPSNGMNFAYAGATGMIAVNKTNDAAFYWTIREHQNNYNDSIIAGVSVNWNNYYPNYFSINGVSNPDINNDPLARVTGNVNDTIYLHVANAGKSKHAFHFHGYHLVIIQSGYSVNDIGRSKDSFPFYSMETMTLMLVPDKPGEFPVHDHNLVAVTGGMVYPTGMFTTMLILP